MKNISNYINECLTGKHLFEKLKVGRNSFQGYNIPYFYENDIYPKKIVGVIDLPNPGHKYYVYRDKYRFNAPHLAALDDMLMSITQFWSDFEDFDPTKDILYSSNDIKDVVKWYLTEFKKLPLPNKKMRGEDYENKYKGKIDLSVSNQGYTYDRPSILIDFYFGYDVLPEDKNFKYMDADAVYKSLSEYYDVKYE